MKTIPIDFISSRVSLSWRDALWGYERQYMGWKDIVSLAEDRLRQGSFNPLEIELASCGKSEAHRVGELLGGLANSEQDTENHIERLWLFLVLAWLYENKDDIQDPFYEVFSVYSDFDYPDEIRHFADYRPAVDEESRADRTPEESHEMFLTNWKRYLQQVAQDVRKLA
jgi:hypothetical protein